MLRQTILLACLLAAPAFGQHIMDSVEANPPAGLVVGAGFNEGQGGKDWSENGNTVAPVGATFAATEGYKFEVTSSQYMLIGSSASLDSVVEMTATYWFSIESKGAANAVRALFNPYKTDTDRWVTYYYNNAGFYLTAYNDVANAGLPHGTLFNPDVTTWYLYSMTISAGDVWTQYINGTQIDQASDGQNQGDMASGYVIYIGLSSIGGLGGYHDGWMDEICVYDRVLSTDEIKNLYQRGKADGK